MQVRFSRCRPAAPGNAHTPERHVDPFGNPFSGRLSPGNLSPRRRTPNAVVMCAFAAQKRTYVLPRHPGFTGILLHPQTLVFPRSPPARVISAPVMRKLSTRLCTSCSGASSKITLGIVSRGVDGPRPKWESVGVAPALPGARVRERMPGTDDGVVRQRNEFQRSHPPAPAAVALLSAAPIAPRRPTEQQRKTRT